MLFGSPAYGAFLIVTWSIFWLLGPRRRRVRAVFLVAASYAFYFYGTWDAARDEPVPVAAPWWAFACLCVIFAGSTLDYFVGRALARASKPSSRNALLGLSIGYYLGVLAVFKYWDFAADSIAALGAAVGAPVGVTYLRLVLPFGISFFTFETMSYTIDVWRREIEPARSYVDYLLFVCFFPHLVAGPIVRPAQMLPQLASAARPDPAAQARGLWRIATGLAKKIVLGDLLARTIVNPVFSAPERFTALEVLVAAYGYAFQIYADFSGYTDVAIGSAALFGYVLPENFDAPYLSGDLQEFWRRWHISLSTWLRDYLYKPLGGSRRGSPRTYRNLMITMVLGGLWHGASWTFVIWGALHGAALAVTRAWQRARPAARAAGKGRAARALAVLATFHFVVFAWIFFRAPSFDHALLVLRQIARGAWHFEHLTSEAQARITLALVAAALLHAAPHPWKIRLRETFVRTPALVQGLVLAVAAFALHFAALTKPEPFVYGQF